MKTCVKCKVAKDPDEGFYRNPGMASGHVNKCKSCIGDEMAARYRERRGYWSAYRRQYLLAHKEKVRASKIDYNRNRRDPVKAKANKLVTSALRSGRLTRRPCECCGSLTVEAHHEDYSKPLEVRWLCFKHHREAHGQVVTVEVPRNRKPNVIVQAAP